MPYTRMLPGENGSPGCIACSGLERLGQREDEASAVQVVGVLTIRGHFLVAEVVDARLQSQVVGCPERYASIDETVSRITEAIGAGTAGAGLPASGSFAAVVVLRPDVDSIGGLPVQRGVEHVLGDIIERLALE